MKDVSGNLSLVRLHVNALLDSVAVVDIKFKDFELLVHT